MVRKIKLAINRGTAEESGAVLVLVLVLLVLGGLIIAPLLNFVSTGLQSTLVFKNKSDEVYAADAGIEDARHKIKYYSLEYVFTDPPYSTPYSTYDYTTDWTYNLTSQVNTKDVDVTIENIWIPKNIPVPDAAEANAIITSEKLVVTGSTSGTTGKVNITYSPETGEDLRITSVGVWIPYGFDYVPGSSSLEVNPGDPYYSVPVIQEHAGNQSITWSFSSVPFIDFPGVDEEDLPMVSEITYQFTPITPGDKPVTISWVTTSGVADIPYSWDADTKVFKITSLAGNTRVEAYTSKEEIRHLRSAISGDYVASGNSLMIDTNGDYAGVRDLLLSSSDAVVNAIPQDAEVGAAFLYWSAWRNQSAKQTVFYDNCSNLLTNWAVSGSNWAVSSGDFRGHYSSGTDSTRYITLNTSLNLSSYAPGTVLLSWYQAEDGTLETDDGLDFSISNDGGLTWGNSIQAFRNDIGTSDHWYYYTIPTGYLTTGFKVRFYLNSFSGSSEYCRIDNIYVQVMPPDTSAIFRIDGQQVYLDGNGAPQQGSEPINSSKTQVLPVIDSSDNPNGYSYSCYKDVTELVRAFSAKAPDPAINHPGNGTYTAGDVMGDTGSEWSYAAWSLIIIYSSADSYGHQLYLYDKFSFAAHDTNIDFDGDGQPGGTISGFIVPNPIEGEVNAAKLTVMVGEGDNCYTGDYLRFNGTNLSNAQSPANNVWNSRFPGGTNDGIDIDTFDITWASGLLDSGDTSAQIDLPTDVDNWDLVYIIISFRSETTTGGSLSYLIRQ